MKRNRTLKAAFAAVLAALMALAVFPVSALPRFEAEKSPAAPFWTVPEGYNANDYNKCVEFLEQEDENGVKNGQKLNSAYDPNDPETWQCDSEDDWGGLFFDLDGEYDSDDDSYKLCAVFIENFDMVGVLDLSECSILYDLSCYNNRLTEIDLRGTPNDYLILADGDGYVGFGMLENYEWGVHAQALYNTGFEGFYSMYDEVIPSVEGFDYVCECSPDNYVITARFGSTESNWETEWWTPYGYNPYDYEKCVAFLEQKDESGVKNGEKLRSDYHPAYPLTWNPASVYAPRSVVWHDNYDDDSGYDDWEDPEAYRVRKLKSLTLKPTEKLVGSLDLSGCSMLEKLDCQNNAIETIDVSDCTALEKIICQKNRLSELDISNAAALKYLYCFNNSLTELDVSSNSALLHLIVNGNELTELDVANNTALEWLDCYNNELSELDVSQNPDLKELLCEDLCAAELDLGNNPELAFDLIVAEGLGTIGYADGRRTSAVSDTYYEGTNKRYLYAYPQDGARFEGFYDENGELLSQGNWNEEYQAYTFFISSSDPAVGTVTARFAEDSGIPGDTDGDGEVSATDALLLLRFCVGELSEDQIDIEAADVNGDGAIDLLDALLTLRIALGEV